MNLDLDFALPWVVITFLLGGAITYLITLDGLLERLRSRWDEHFEYRQDQIFQEIANHHRPFKTTAISSFTRQHAEQGGRLLLADRLTWGQQRLAMRNYVSEQAREEQAVPMWAARRPQWAAWESQLQWQAIKASAIRCASCAGFWSMLVAGIGVWAFSGAPQDIGPWPWWASVVVWAFILRWPYTLIAMRYPD